jgi:hypothetical protein
LALHEIIDRAKASLVQARTSAEILEARDQASLAYSTAKQAGRIERARGAHVDLIRRAYVLQRDALEIEAKAKIRLADEYDAAQERGEVAGNGQRRAILDENSSTTSDIGRGFGRRICLRRFRQADAWSAAVLLNEDDAGGLEGAAHHGKTGALGRGLLIFKVSNSDSAHLGGAGEMVLVPFEQAARGATLSGRHKRHL